MIQSAVDRYKITCLQCQKCAVDPDLETSGDAAEDLQMLVPMQTVKSYVSGKSLYVQIRDEPVHFLDFIIAFGFHFQFLRVKNNVVLIEYWKKYFRCYKKKIGFYDNFNCIMRVERSQL